MPSPAASKGTLVHKALEYLFARPPSERTFDAAQSDLAVATDTLASHRDFSSLELSTEEWSKFHSDARELLRKYFELEDPTTIRPIGLELKLEARLGTARVRGIIDRLELDEAGGLVVSDYKTGAVPRSNFEKIAMSGIHLYAALCESVFGQRPVRIQLLYLKGPTAIIATPSQQSTAATQRRTSAIWSAVERACLHDDFRPNKNRLCEWCTFKPYCPEFGGDPDRASELRSEP